MDVRNLVNGHDIPMDVSKKDNGNIPMGDINIQVMLPRKSNNNSSFMGLNKYFDIKKMDTQKDQTMCNQENSTTNKQDLINYNNIDIKFSEEMEIDPLIEPIKHIGKGGYGATDIVKYDGRLCVRKTALHGFTDKKEIKIMTYLNGAGGAPILHVATKKYFLCSYVGDQRFCDLFAEREIHLTDLLFGMVQVAKKVKEIHDLGICHNDLKFDNVMVNSNLEMVDAFSLIDFGLSCPSGTNTFRGSEVETFAQCDWMSPEVRKGQECSSSSDVYSLGSMVNEIISNSVQQCPSILTTLVNNALKENPNERPTIEEFIADLGYSLERKEDFQLHDTAQEIRQCGQVNMATLDDDNYIMHRSPQAIIDILLLRTEVIDIENIPPWVEPFSNYSDKY